MPFDGHDFEHGRPAPKRPAVSENAISVGIAVLATFLLAMPFSLVSLVDLVRFIQGR